MGDDRPPRYVEVNDDGEEIVVYRASGLFMCDRIFVAYENGYTPKEKPEWFQEVLDEGTRMEDDILRMFSEKYEEALAGEDQREVNWEVMPGVFIRGHIDELTNVGATGTCLVEAKKFRDSTWQKLPKQKIEIQPYYPGQASIYLHALRDEFDDDTMGLWFVGGHYMTKTDDRGDNVEEWIDDVEAYYYADPPLPRIAILKRVKHLENLIRDGMQPDEVACPDNKMFPCPFFYLHDDSEVESTERPADDTLKDLIGWLHEAEEKARHHQKIADEAKKRIKDMKGGIKGWLEAAGVAEDIETNTVVGGKEYVLKYHTIERKGYEVKPTSYEAVVVKPVGGKKKAAAKVAAKKRVVKKAATKRTVK